VLPQSWDLLPIAVPSMVPVGGRQEVVHSWTHWALRLYTDQGSFQDAVVKMICVSLVDKFQILIILYFDM
jgi:hypothetical protein